MRVLHTVTRRRFLAGAWMLTASCITIAEAATIAGVVRDAHGNPLNGAQVKMICERAPEKNAQTTSGKDGAYRFVELLPGKCQLSVERSGFRGATPVVVSISSASTSVVSDFTLSQILQEGAATTSQRASVV